MSVSFYIKKERLHLYDYNYMILYYSEHIIIIVNMKLPIIQQEFSVDKIH